MRQLVQAVFSIALPLTLIAPASTSAVEFTAKDLAAEEGKFASYSVKNGMRVSFIVWAR